MPFSKSFIATVLIACALAPPVVADDCSTTCTNGSGPVKLFRSVSGGTPTLVRCETAGADFSFDVSSWTGANLLIICHCGSPMGNIGRVTITGDPGGSLTSLFVAVVGATEDPMHC